MNEEKKEDFTAEILFYDNKVEESLNKMTDTQRADFFQFCRSLFCLRCGKSFQNIGLCGCPQKMQPKNHSHGECEKNRTKYMRHVNEDPNDTREFYTKVKGYYID